MTKAALCKTQSATWQMQSGTLTSAECHFTNTEWLFGKHKAALWNHPKTTLANKERHTAKAVTAAVHSHDTLS